MAAAVMQRALSKGHRAHGVARLAWSCLTLFCCSGMHVRSLRDMDCKMFAILEPAVIVVTASLGQVCGCWRLLLAAGAAVSRLGNRAWTLQTRHH